MDSLIPLLPVDHTVRSSLSKRKIAEVDEQDPFNTRSITLKPEHHEAVRDEEPWHSALLDDLATSEGDLFARGSLFPSRLPTPNPILTANSPPLFASFSRTGSREALADMLSFPASPTLPYGSNGLSSRTSLAMDSSEEDDEEGEQDGEPDEDVLGFPPSPSFAFGSMSSSPVQSSSSNPPSSSESISPSLYESSSFSASGSESSSPRHSYSPYEQPSSFSSASSLPVASYDSIDPMYASSFPFSSSAAASFAPPLLQKAAPVHQKATAQSNRSKTKQQSNGRRSSSANSRQKPKEYFARHEEEEEEVEDEHHCEDNQGYAFSHVQGPPSEFGAVTRAFLGSEDPILKLSPETQARLSAESASLKAGLKAGKAFPKDVVSGMIFELSHLRRQNQHLKKSVEECDRTYRNLEDEKCILSHTVQEAQEEVQRSAMVSASSSPAVDCIISNTPIFCVGATLQTGRWTLLEVNRSWMKLFGYRVKNGVCEPAIHFGNGSENTFRARHRPERYFQEHDLVASTIERRLKSAVTYPLGKEAGVMCFTTHYQSLTGEKFLAMLVMSFHCDSEKSPCIGIGRYIKL